MLYHQGCILDGHSVLNGRSRAFLTAAKEAFEMINALELLLVVSSFVSDIIFRIYFSEHIVTNFRGCIAILRYYF